MSVQRPRALILTGDGIFGELELAYAFHLAGFEAEIRHINDLIAEHFGMDELSLRYQVVSFPNGSTYGGALASGQIFALKLARGLGWDFQQFAARGGLVLGVNHGFHVLLRLGVFGKDLSVVHGLSGRFWNSWMRFTPMGSRCVWLKGVGSLDLPLRHAEGKIVISSFRKAEALAKMERSGMLCLSYESPLEQGLGAIAGLCDPSGRIFGLMPHPELFVRWTSHPEWTSAPGRAAAPGQGLALFENAYQEAMRAL